MAAVAVAVLQGLHTQFPYEAFSQCDTGPSNKKVLA